MFGPRLVGASRHKWSEWLCFQLLSSNVVNDLMLLEPLLDNLTARLKDSSASVRRLVLRGLANIASGSPDKVGQPPGDMAEYKGQHGVFSCLGVRFACRVGQAEYSGLLGASSWPPAHDGYGQWAR